jgi:formylglycine-generating enzyme required for sulfatase activity
LHSAGSCWDCLQDARSTVRSRRLKTEGFVRRYADDDGRNRKNLTEARVARGGSWCSASIALLSIAYRDTFQPEVRYHDLGFRVVAKPLP